MMLKLRLNLAIFWLLSLFIMLSRFLRHVLMFYFVL